jgi:hypothetical protein
MFKRGLESMIDDYAYRRRFEGQSALAVLNNSLLPRTIVIPTDLPEGTAVVDALSERRFTVCGGRLEFSPLEPRRPLVLTAYD